MAELQCNVVTPEQSVHEGAAEFIAVMLHDGEIGIAPGHTPILGRLGYGEMRITTEGRTDRYYVEAGFIEVLDDQVTILTNRAIPAADLDESVVREQLEAARATPANTPDLMGIRDIAVAKSRAQLMVARRT